MSFPFKIIESKISNRNEFNLIDGHQPTHALFYLKKGRFYIEIDGAKEEIQAGDCVILPDYIHFRRNVINPIEFIFIKFACISNCHYSLNLPYGKISFKDKHRFSSNISALERLINNDTPLSAGYREHLLMDILFQIHFEQNLIDISSSKPAYYDKLTEAAVSYITRNLNKKILIEDICHAIRTNPSTLNFKFRREFNMSVGQFIINERIKKAKHLLISSTYSISEIATRCGFEDVYYFSNTFKKYTKLSPSSYRKKEL